MITGVRLKRTFYIAGLTVLLMLAGCGTTTGEEEERPADAIKLYKSTCRLIRMYADSIRNAPDSVTAIGAFEHLQSELDSLNFSVKVNTDLMLTEGENDTIHMNLVAVRTIYDNKLKALNRRTVIDKIEEQP